MKNSARRFILTAAAFNPTSSSTIRVGAGRMDMEGLRKKEGFFGGDFGTPEQQIPATGLPGVDWETCMTMNDHWGYNKKDKNFKSSKDIDPDDCADIASKGGNYLLNVGPTSEGLIPPESIERLRTVGEWMKVNGEAIYETKASPFHSLDWGKCTRKEIPGGVRLYLHIFNWPETGSLAVPGVLNEPLNAYFLADANHSSLTVSRSEDALMIKLPSQIPDSVNTVVVLDLKGNLDITDPPQILSDFDVFVDTLQVRLKSERENVQIRYTTDQSGPDLKSKLYTGPFSTGKSIMVAARCYRDGKPVSGVSTRIIRKIEANPAVNLAKPVPGIVYSYYEGTWDSVPDFDKLKPLKEGTLGNFSLDQKKIKEFYGFRFKGYILIPSDDMYAFYISSDDGSTFYG
jgi:alpha-L-fucosidase